MIKYFLVSPFFEVIIISLFPLFILPNETDPSTSETTAGLEGFLASNNWVTLGNPPVISPEDPTALGILHRTVPCLISWLSSKEIWAPTGIL